MSGRGRPQKGRGSGSGSGSGGGGKPRGGSSGGKHQGGGRPAGGGGRPPGGSRGTGGGSGGGKPRGRRPVSDLAIDPEELVYGRHPVREAIRGPRTVHTVFVTESAQRDLGSMLNGVRDVVVVESGELAERSGTDDHQGVVAHVTRTQTVTIDDLLERTSVEQPALILALDQITDPHNLGAIARVCDAAGATGLLLPEHRSASVTGAVCKASAGAVEHVAIARCTNLADTIERIKSGALWVYGASEKGTRRYTDVDCAGPVVLVLGSEGSGIRPRVQRSCDELISVPMAGEVSSLNVATVAAVLTFEAVRQRGGVA